MIGRFQINSQRNTAQFFSARPQDTHKKNAQKIRGIFIMKLTHRQKKRENIHHEKRQNYVIFIDVLAMCFKTIDIKP